ncbi:DUF4192 family protein, partial [Promicromonospora kroppenstedtii]|uniref:DUF4192 family protein n=1 Tax=Promicromonospora kroppenstedtii TaxID=440482 RepID=UPI000564E066
MNPDVHSNSDNGLPDGGLADSFSDSLPDRLPDSLPDSLADTDSSDRDLSARDFSARDVPDRTTPRGGASPRTVVPNRGGAPAVPNARVVRVAGPEDLLAYIPYRLGFEPVESVVVVSLTGPRQRVGLVARVDLADLRLRRPGDPAGPDGGATAR